MSVDELSRASTAVLNLDSAIRDAIRTAKRDRTDRFCVTSGECIRISDATMPIDDAARIPISDWDHVSFFQEMIKVVESLLGDTCAALNAAPELGSPGMAQYATQLKPSMHVAVVEFAEELISSRVAEPESWMLIVSNYVLPERESFEARVNLENQRTKDARERSKSAVASNADSSSRVMHDGAEFVFGPDGDGYFIQAFGESGRFSARGAKGFHDIYRLVHSANQPVSMRELDEDPAVVQAEKQEKTDKKTLDEVERDMAELTASMKAEPDSPENSTRRKEFDQLVEYARTAKDRTGRIRDINNNESKNLSSRIWNRMKWLWGDVKDQKTGEIRFGTLKKAMPETAKHFEESITVGNDSVSYIYRPGEPARVWKNSDSEAQSH